MAELSGGQLRFKPRARIIRTIGDRLISGPEAAVIELVKNAYDADASFVEIVFVPGRDQAPARIAVLDNGHGMSLADIHDKWMEPATSSKVNNRLSPIRKRKMMGSKGIGRFAAAKLGGKMSLSSTTLLDGNTIAVLIPELDWSIFTDDAYLSDIAIDYIEHASEEPTGTLIEVTDLSQEWTLDKMLNLFKELRRLLSPFVETKNSADDFSVFLDVSKFDQEIDGFSSIDIYQSDDDADGEAVAGYSGAGFRVPPLPLLSNCDYELSGVISADGSFDGSFTIHRGERAAEPVNLPATKSGGGARVGRVELKLFIFDRDAVSLKKNMKTAGFGNLKVSEARAILDEICGVAIYRDDFRVRPYGDPENDWLVLDSRRVQNPSMCIGHNQMAGYLKIEDEASSSLLERSSREGFEENESFRCLTQYITRLLTEVVEPKRYRFRDKAGLSRKNTTSFGELKELSELKRIRELFVHLEARERAMAEAVVDRESARLTQRIDAMRERQRVLEANSSLGAIISEILHEGSPNVMFVRETSQRMKNRLKSLLMGSDEEKEVAQEFFSKRIPALSDAGNRLSSLFKMLRPLSGSRGARAVLFYPKKTIEDALVLFDSHGIEFDVTSSGDGMEFIGHAEDLTTAVVNIVGNSAYWLKEAEVESPTVKIRLSLSDEGGHVTIHDNGPGVADEFVDEIFDVGFSLKSGGTGLGLNIAREALARSGGKLRFYPETDEGALFEIIFPVGA